jgi:hypothetical protein
VDNFVDKIACAAAIVGAEPPIGHRAEKSGTKNFLNINSLAYSAGPAGRTMVRSASRRAAVELSARAERRFGNG